MSAFFSSPVWGAIISVAGAALVGLIAMISRMLGKVNRIEEKMTEIAQDVTDMKNDKNIVRWSDLAHTRRGGRRRVF